MQGNDLHSMEMVTGELDDKEEEGEVSQFVGVLGVS